ncbi:MAG: DUF1549 domain-containing protein [Planctomyces sp.]|nr:DUF1549 domain-containing protein [Planctomyces sp.]
MHASRRPRLTIALLAALWLSGGRAAATEGEAGSESAGFEPIARLLAARCLGCHAGADAKAGLDLTHRDGALRGGEGGPALAPGDAEASPLWERVRDGDMPPDKPLDEADQRLLRAWIDGGAAWGAEAIDPFRFTTETRAGYDWWSLQPLAPASPPAVQNESWVRNDIDRFVLERLEAAGLAPSEAASPRALLRRVTIDLTGLPPTAEEMAAFEADPGDAAYEAIVDRLLSSPQYGERWGRHWLDIARYGESNGFERNGPRDHFWQYRDWVIEALNADLPYPEFVRQQIAGDLLTGGTEGAAAVGFLVAGVHNTVVGSSERMRRLARQDELEEVAGTLGQAFLGMTVHCARCHDHKFDPIRTEEYYRFIAALDGIQHGDRDELPVRDAAELAGVAEALAVVEASTRELMGTAGRRLAIDAAAGPAAPEPRLRWSFDRWFADDSGRIAGEVHGGARIEYGALVLDGARAWAASAPLNFSVGEKTLEAWVQLDSLEQRGGGVISLQFTDGSVFDAIVFGEREPRRWMAGSDGFARTQPLGGAEETEAMDRPVHVAIVYRQDGTIAAYRDGAPYGQPYQTGFATFGAGQAQLVFGMRHSPPGGDRMLMGRIHHAQFYDRALDDAAVRASFERGFSLDRAKLLAALNDVERAAFASLEERRGELQSRRDRLLARRERLYSVTPADPEAMRVHVRGGVTDFGPEVSAGGLSAVTGAAADFGLPAGAGDRERRLALARWITEDARPLLNRVIVNRLWQHHFGAGLVETPSDLGFNGGSPSHPELLDFLARELEGHGGRLKALHRQLTLSSTYRQSSRLRRDAFEVDAGNRLLWRASPRRLDAETLRDAMLQSSGALNLEAGGPGFRDVELLSLNGTTYYLPIEADRPEFHRRSIYRFVPRDGASALLETFDCPDPSVTAPQRTATTTPLQALSLLNNSFVLAMSGRVARRAEAGTESREAAVGRVWELIVGRLPEDVERTESAALVERHGLAALARGLFNASEFLVIE